MVAFVLAGGCAPKRVVNSEPRAETPPREPTTAAVEDPRLPPELPDLPPEERERVDQLPEPRVRVASGSSREAADSGTSLSGSAGSGSRSGALGDRAAALAQDQLGKQYQWGASGPDKFDCSGLVMYVYNELGVPLPRVSRQQASAGYHVDRKDLKPGDLVFFHLNGSRIDHVGIYVGGSRFVHAPRRYMPVRTDSLNDSYWRQRYRGARRVG
jgi:cell wall-associated NlpC family hydrolase